MDLIHTDVELEIGSVVEAVGPPSVNWKCADGQILNQAEYPQYVASCQELHPKRYEGLRYMNERTEVPHCCASMGDIIAVAGKGDEVLYTTDGGQNWTVNTPLGSSADYYYGMASDGTTLVTCKYGSNVAYTSTDGINWTSRTMSQSEQWVSVAWTGNYFMALEHGGGKMDYSSDGITWYAATPPDSYFYTGYQAWGNNIFLYYSYSDYKWHITDDGGQSWSASDFFGWFSPDYEGITPYKVGFDGENFVCFFENLMSNSFLKSTDGLTWVWEPFSNTRWDYYDFAAGTVHYDGVEDVFLLQGYGISGTYCSWHMAKKGHVENYKKRISHIVYEVADKTSNESDNKIAVIPGTGMFCIGWEGVKNREIWADFTSYDSTTQFQLPVLSTGLPGGVKKYIRVA